MLRNGLLLQGGWKAASRGLHLEGGCKGASRGLQEAGSRGLYIRGWGMCKKYVPRQSIPKHFEHELRQRLRIASDI